MLHAAREPIDEAAELVWRFIRFVCYYRQNIRAHGKNVAVLALSQLARVERVLNAALPEARIEAEACAHDYMEIFTKLGDRPWAHKALLTPEERVALKELELRAIHWVVKKYGPDYRGFDLARLLLGIHYLEDIVDEYVKWFDTLEGYIWTCHELYGGNRHHAELQCYRGQTVQPAVWNYEHLYLPALQEKLVRLQPLFVAARTTTGLVLFSLPRPRDRSEWIEIALRSTPHTPASLDRLIESQENPHYAAAMRILRDCGRPGVIQRLTTRTGVR